MNLFYLYPGVPNASHLDRRTFLTAAWQRASVVMIPALSRRAASGFKTNGNVHGGSSRRPILRQGIGYDAEIKKRKWLSKTCTWKPVLLPVASQKWFFNNQIHPFHIEYNMKLERKSRIGHHFSKVQNATPP